MLSCSSEHTSAYGPCAGRSGSPWYGAAWSPSLASYLSAVTDIVSNACAAALADETFQTLGRVEYASFNLELEVRLHGHLTAICTC